MSICYLSPRENKYIYIANGKKFGNLHKTRMETDIEYKTKVMQTWQKEGTKAIREKYPKSAFYGKSHTDEWKKNHSKFMKENSTGSRNSQYNSMWITDGINSKKIQKSEDIPLGWIKGRKIKCPTVTNLEDVVVGFAPR